MAFYLGIDGGGSKTTCLLGDETEILGRGDSGGSNVVRSGEQAARDSLEVAILGACARVHIEPAGIARTVSALAGAGREDVRVFVKQALGEILGGEVVVVTDVQAALQAAFSDGPGVVVVAGTGSIALARNSQGETARAGGWGWAISDAGSGSWIGRTAVAEILRQRDRGKVAKILEDSILSRWQFADYQQLAFAANTFPQPDFGVLLPLVVEAANAGDTVAIELFQGAGRELAALAQIAASRVFAAEAHVPVAMSGGAFAHAPNLREAFYNSLQTHLPNATLLPDIADPALGALQMARRGRDEPSLR